MIRLIKCYKMFATLKQTRRMVYENNIQAYIFRIAHSPHVFLSLYTYASGTLFFTIHSMKESRIISCLQRNCFIINELILPCFITLCYKAAFNLKHREKGKLHSSFQVIPKESFKMSLYTVY